MTLALLSLIFGAVHAGVLLAAFTGPRARLAGGLFVIAVNYGLRRLLFLEPGLADGRTLWFGLIALGDLVLVLLVVMSAVRPRPGVRLLPVDGAVAALFLATVVLALADDRTPVLVRAAHWKDEYLYIVAYALARLNGAAALRRPAILTGVAALSVAAAAWQAAAGPTALDLAWVASGRSVLTLGSADEIAGAHGLGNLGAGWLRPYGIFGNATDFGVFLAAVALIAVAARLPAGQPVRIGALARAMLAPVPLMCTAGILLTVVRFTWATLAVAVVAMAIIGAAGTVRRVGRLGILTGSLAAAIAGALVLGAGTAGSASPWDRAFVTGTYLGRVEAQHAYLDYLSANPVILAVGEGFGGFGSAARKLGWFDPATHIDHHSRFLDFVQDGGVALLALNLLPVMLALRRGWPDPQRAAALGFAVSLLLCAGLLGGKSALLQALFWAMLGVAVARTQDMIREAPERSCA